MPKRGPPVQKLSAVPTGRFSSNSTWYAEVAPAPLLLMLTHGNLIAKARSTTRRCLPGGDSVVREPLPIRDLYALPCGHRRRAVNTSPDSACKLYPAKVSPIRVNKPLFARVESGDSQWVARGRCWAPSSPRARGRAALERGARGVRQAALRALSAQRASCSDGCARRVFDGKGFQPFGPEGRAPSPASAGFFRCPKVDANERT
jgi:hypothetical protein